MPSGFFHSSTLRATSAPPSLVPKCGACQLYRTCRTPKMAYSGEGRRGILLVGEAPGDTDDQHGKHFAGRSGRFLQDKLRSYGIDMRRDCWMTNSIICKPHGGKAPTDDQVDYCRPNLLKTIKELEPTVIILLGITAVRSVMGSIWDATNIGGINRWVGWTVPFQEWNCWICPTYDISYVQNALTMKRPDPIPDKLFTKHVANAVQFESRPWDVIPKYTAEIEVITDISEAVTAIREIYNTPGDIAFDYEANMLKPDNDQFKIYSCSICINGERTIAYPWTRKTAKATRKLLRHKHGKIASNLKYEDRVTRAQLKTRVRNWKWDTMIAAHVMNNQQGTKSVKFQAFVLLGFPPYNEHIEPLLKSGVNCGYAENQINEISLRDLLIYNGVDSLVEFLVYKEQSKLLK